MAGGSIGVFDSGLGGLNTLRHIAARLPAYDYVYLGDSARAPYGPRTPEEIYTFSTQALDFLFARGAELVIFACNTASSDALHKIQQEYLPQHFPGKRVLGVLIPLAEEAVAKTASKKIGIIATEGTVRSGAFLREIGKLDASIEIIQQACPRLVPLIESGAYETGKKTGETEALLAEYLRPMTDVEVDTLILGCTHYDALKGVIQAIVGPAIRVISEGAIVAEKLEDYLHRHPEIYARLAREGKRAFYSSDTTGRFDALGSRFFGAAVRARRVRL